MNISNPIARVHLQWFAENDGQETPAAPVAAPVAPAAAPPAAVTPPVSWRDGLPENLKGSPSLGKFDAVDKLAKSYVELESMIGKSITPPGKDAKPEDWDRFYSRLGRPKTAEDYAFDPVEGFEADPAFISRLRQTFHAAGLTPAQAKTVFGKIAGEATTAEATAREANAQAIAAGEAALRADWGTNFDNNVARATQYAEQVGGKGAVKVLEDLGVANHPLILKLLARAGEATNGRNLVRGSTTNGSRTGRYYYMNEGKIKPD
jgi:hypothetical protein